MESHLRVEIVPRTPEGGPATVRIDGAEFPILAYAIDQDDSGAPALSLVLSPDSLSIGEPPTGAPHTPTTKVSSWGEQSQPDPRESIPGWQPEKLSEQVASHAERVALRQILSPMTYLRRGNGGSVAVTA